MTLIFTFAWQPLAGLVMYLNLILYNPPYFLFLATSPHVWHRLLHQTFFVSLFLSGISENRWENVFSFCDSFIYSEIYNGLTAAYSFLIVDSQMPKVHQNLTSLVRKVPKLQIWDHFSSIKNKCSHLQRWHLIFRRSTFFFTDFFLWSRAWWIWDIVNYS